jgi:hypothetical protein
VTSLAPRKAPSEYGCAPTRNFDKTCYWQLLADAPTHYSDKLSQWLATECENQNVLRNPLREPTKTKTKKPSPKHKPDNGVCSSLSFLH